EADRPQIPDKDNAALHVIAVIKQGGSVTISGAPRYDLIFEKLAPNAELNEQQVQFLRVELARLGKALDEARRLKDMPRGRFPFNISDDYFSTVLTDQQKVRTLADWLKHDACMLAHEHKIDEAAQSCQALLHAGRTLVGEPTLISMLIHVSAQTI